MKQTKKKHHKEKQNTRSLWKYLEEYEPNIDIGQSGHYSHENTMYFNDHSFYEGTGARSKEWKQDKRKGNKRKREGLTFVSISDILKY